MNQPLLRPGGRTALVREAVLRATWEALGERGSAGLDLADIARRAGVGKTTVYRRWGTVPGLLADVLDAMGEAEVHRIDSGSLEADLTVLALIIRASLADPREGPMFKAFIAAAIGDEAAAKALHRFYRIRAAAWKSFVERAVERGEAPAGTDAFEVIWALSAPLYYRLLASGDPLDEPAAKRAAAACAAAARAGVFVTAPSEPRPEPA